jgi:REP element-mobilizing transposase RayT
MVRGVERRSIFRTDVDRLDFLQRLSSGLNITHSSCLTWAMMSNHFHLLIITGIRGLAALMHPLLTGYVGAFNRRHKRVGHLVQNRFRAILCQKDSYLLELIRYIPLNPVRAGLVKTPKELALYPWSGHSAILGLRDYPWQATEEVLSHFGSQVISARQAYESHVLSGWTQGRRTDLEGGGLIRSLGGLSQALQARVSGEQQAYDSRILGDGNFVEGILTEVEHAEAQRQRARNSGLTLNRIQNLAAALSGVAAPSLLRRDRCQPVTQARSLFVYAATEILEIRLSRLAALLGMSSGALSEIRKRGERLNKEHHFTDRLLGQDVDMSLKYTDL